MMRTRTKQDAGKHAKFERVFMLDKIEQLILSNEKIVFEAMDEDTTSDELLAKTEPIPYETFVLSLDKIKS